MAALVVVVTAAFGLCARSARAHEIQPAIADVSFAGAEYAITIALNLEAIVAQIEPEHEDTDESANAASYASLRALSPAELRRAFDAFAPTLKGGITLTADGARLDPAVVDVQIPEVGDAALARISKLRLGGPLPRGAAGIVWSWDARFGSIVLRAGEEGAEGAYTAYLAGGDKSDVIPVVGAQAQPAWSLFRDYVVIGFLHILPKGLDHILFVVGLFLLSLGVRPLLWQISAFTVAHTVTLALGMLGIVKLPPSIVEPLIALSISYVCIENIFRSKISRQRTVVVFLFGLLHGLGFAGVLTEIGLSPTHFVTGLVAFNLGVELGQLTVIALCFLAVGAWFARKPWYRTYLTIPASFVIALVGLYWFVERAFLS